MAIQEKLTIDGLDTNDDANFVLEALTFTPAQKKPQWIDNADADGELLLEEPHYTNAKFEAQIRVVTRATMDLALAALGQIQDKLQKAARTAPDGGLATVWTPADSTEAYTWYALLGEVANWPIQPNGDLAGWFIKTPVIGVTLTCRPFGYRPQVTVLAATASALPLQEATLADAGGDVAAEGELTLTDTAAQDRRHVEWGLTSAAENSALGFLLDSDALVTAGYSGTGAARAGAYDPGAAGNSVVRGTAVAAGATTVCGTGELSHVGTFRVKARVYTDSANVRWRLAYRVGDGTLTTLPWVGPEVTGAFAEIDLGEVSIDELLEGTHKWEARVETYSVGASAAGDIDYLELIPTERYGVARGPASSAASLALSAYDEFDQAGSPALNAQNAPLGGAWSGAGDADDFSIVSGAAQRSAVSDANVNTGRFGLLGVTNYAAAKIAGSFGASAGIANPLISRLGLLLRYVNTTNWVMAVLERNLGDGKISVYKSTTAAGVVQLATTSFAAHTFGSAFGTGAFPPILLDFEITADGVWTANAGQSGYGSGPTTSTITGQHADLATGGTLATGRPGIYDGHASVFATTRYVHYVNLFTPEAVRRALHASRRIRITHDDARRENAAGTRWGTPPLYRGSRLYLPPGANNRIAVKARRNDVALESDGNIADGQTLEVKATPRYLTPR
jgi:hypothetical protein